MKIGPVPDLQELPSGRWHLARETRRLIGTNKSELNVLDHCYKIKWAGERPQVPHDGRNPPATEEGKIVLDNKVDDMIRKKVFRVADTSVKGVISGYFARPKKAEGKFCPIVSLKYTNSFIVHRKVRIITTNEVARWIRCLILTSPSRFKSGRPGTHGSCDSVNHIFAVSDGHRPFMPSDYSRHRSDAWPNPGWERRRATAT